MREPPLVARAKVVAVTRGLAGSWDDDRGALLHVLAAGRHARRVAAIGTGAGVATAWIASALPPGTPLFAADADPERVAAAVELFADDPELAVIEGDWRTVLAPEAPFDFIFVDRDYAGEAVADVLGLAAPRATLVVDHATTGQTARAPGEGEWLQQPRLDAVEVAIGEAPALIVAVVQG